jgi:L-ascorbate metabolism protein UlaG (beta-lactamase superfamily)
LEHHTPDGFRNNYPTGPRGSFWKWRWERFWSDLPVTPENGYDLEVLPVRLHTPAGDGEITLTWIGHATLLLQLGGLNVLTDPHLTGRASPFSFLGPKRKVPPALSLEELPRIDVVLISHNHYDHLDRPTVVGLARQPGGSPRFFVPLGMKAWFADEGIEDVVEQDWWQHSDYRGLRIHQVPAQHFSARGLFDRNEVLWGGFVVEHPGFRFYFAGDAGYGPDFADIGARFGSIDLAALPIGAYEPRWFMKAMHIDPAEAVQAQQDLRARYAVAMHWGTFEMTDEPFDEPPQALARALQAAGRPPERFFLLKHGETRVLTPLRQGQGAGGGEPSLAQPCATARKEDASC